MKKFLLFYIILFSLNINAQDLFFCRSVTDNGQPIDADIKWKIEPYGKTISILFKSKEILENDLFYLFIDKESDGVFKPYDSKTQRADGTKNWLQFEHKFKEEGEYEIYVMNADQKILVTNHLTTSFTDVYNSVQKNEDLSYSYYDNVKITFCERVFTNKPYNAFQSTSLSNNNGQVFVFIDNGKPLNTDIILVYIYKKKNRAFEYDDFVDSKKFRVDENWNNTFFKYQFTEPGDYKISIFNKNEKPIKNGFIKVR